MSDISSIGVWGNAGSGINDGYGYAGFKLCKTLNSLGIQTYWEDEGVPIALSFKQPPGYGGAAHQFKIGYTPWESTRVPEGWVDIINQQDLFWTTSAWCEKIFLNAGVKVPTRVVRHGIDPDDWTVSRREHLDNNHFIFFHMGEPADRKNGQMVLDAFDKCFNGNPHIQLFFKANGYMVARWKDRTGSIIADINSHPQVSSYKGILSIAELNNLYRSMHCLVYPSSGEGFGLIPFQAMATGMPTILPDWSGMAEFSRYGINVDYEVGPSQNDYHLGDWCWPSFDDLCDKMVYVYENYHEVSEKAYYNGLLMREEFNWKDIVSKEIDFLKGFI